MRRARSETVILGGILLVRLLAALWFASQTPLWEQIDEINHYQYARFLAFEGRLPRDEDRPPVPQGLEVFLQFDQPPLYHAMLSPSILAFDEDGQMPVFANPPPSCDIPFRQRYIHGEDERFPFDGVARAAWAARLMTILMGVLATLMVWLTTRILFPEKRRLGLMAAGLFAFMPATVELSTWINNDAPLMLFGAVALYWLARLWRGDRGWFVWIGLLVAAGLCVGTKLNGAAILPAIGMMLFWRLVWRAEARRLLRLFVFLDTIVLIGAGFVGLNYWQCGRAVCRIHRDTFVFNSFDALWASVINDKFVAASQLLLRSGTTPWLSDLYPPEAWEIRFGAVIFGIGLGGALSVILGERKRRGRLLILVGIIMSAVGLAYLRVWWLQVSYMPVRYMAVAFPAFAILLAIGYGQLGNWFTKWGVVLPLGGLSAMVILIPLVHYRPLLVDVDRYDRLPESAQPIENYQFESGVEIGGFSQGRTADDRLRLRLYMTTLEDIEEPLFAMVYVLDDNRIPIGRCGIVAGDSMWTTMNWKRGEMVAQEFYFESSLAVYFEIEQYYLQNRYHLVNQYDLRRPDPRISGDLIKLE